jgi:XRE family aerobic/anaerobic benzoate catabolism transcriptional regulator
MRHPAHPGPAAAVLATLSRKTRQLRLARGLTLRALSDKSGLSLRYLMDVEAGRGNISVRRLADLADALQTTAADLVTAEPATAVPRPIALIGVRGAGKTTVGRRLARRLKRRFLELDRLVESRAGLALAEIFSLHGEAYYRRLERDALVDLLGMDQPLVIAAGGGLVTSPDTYNLLLQRALTVWLRGRPEDYWNRVVKQGDRRPIDQHPHARQAFRRLVADREPLYARAAITIDTSTAGIDQIVRRLAADPRLAP